MSILNENHTIPHEFHNMPFLLSTHVAKTTAPDNDATTETEKSNTGNIDCIPLKDQIIPNPLLKKIFGTAEKYNHLL